VRARIRVNSGPGNNLVQVIAGLAVQATLVEVVEPNSIARTDFKARRVLDDRKIFVDMHRQLEGVES